PSSPLSIQMAALGRPFNLGMFYDCRSDKLIPGLTLWDKEKLDRDMEVSPQPNTGFQILASESISDKSSSLGVEASLKASFLSGLVNVEGSAKYLNDNKKSTKQARVTLQYKTTTVFKSLTMNQLATKNLTHCEVIDKGLATHVVTAILYGAQAFFVFDRESSEGESVQDIQGNLKVMIERIPLIKIDGSGALKIEDKDREKVNKFSCTFHGDFLLEKSPTMFEEAVKVYQDLPRLLGPNKENVVPVTVHLLPLTTLDSKASKLVRQISLRLVTEAEKVLEGFTELEMWCNDVLETLCSEFQLGLQRTLSQKLPSIRGGGEEEEALAEVLKKVAQGPFNSDRLKQWMEDKDDETNAVKSLMKLMQNTETVSSKNALSDKVCDSEKALVFVLTSLDSTEPFLSELEQHLKGSKSNSSDAPEPRRWYSSEDMIYTTVRRKAKLFSDFAEANKDKAKKSLQFLVVGLADKNQEGSAIYLYEDGGLISKNVELPSKPGPLTVGEVTHNTVSLHFSAPSEGAHSVTEYRVEFSEKGKEEWNQQLQAEAGEVTVTGLSSYTEYSIRVRAVTDLGVGPAAAPKTSIRTLPYAPPEDLTGTASDTEIRVQWRRPQVGQGENIPRYIVEYGETQEKIQWKREQSQSEEMMISGLQPETTYSIRVLCDCGEHGMSRESSTITVTTKEKASHQAGTDLFTF
uniref:Fibronectin type-III domain-containing protein n=1 Tax=Neogobius melanostomus TaxID=47308 RepID=A0A8C6SIZ6_9GOBI